jgi:hypothetical protein
VRYSALSAPAWAQIASTAGVSQAPHRGWRKQMHDEVQGEKRDTTGQRGHPAAMLEG